MSLAAAGSASAPASHRRMAVVSAIGTAQILAWGSSYYLTAVLAGPVAADTGWSMAWIVGGLSLGFLVSGLVSPRVGRLIDAHGGRPVLAASAVLLACGLLTLGLAPTLPMFVGGWLVIGLGMGAGLYDPAFSALGRLYGDAARSAITHVTLFGGFASTVCWPLSAFLVDHLGWRGACLTYAAVHVGVVLPLSSSASRARRRGCGTPQCQPPTLLLDRCGPSSARRSFSSPPGSPWPRSS